LEECVPAHACSGRSIEAAAQHGAVADAAVRPQDRGDFEGWFWLECFPDLWVRRS
jgi:hypothetical protein